MGTAIINAFANALNLVLTFIPKFIGFLVILLVGWIVAPIAFGLGEQDTARRYLNRTESTAGTAADRIDTEQVKAQAGGADGVQASQMRTR